MRSLEQSELSYDMNTPEVLYAAIWEHQRKPCRWIFRGTWKWIYKTTERQEKLGKKSMKDFPEKKGKWRFQFPEQIRIRFMPGWKWLRKGSRWSICLRWAGEKLELVNKWITRLTQRACNYIEVFANSEWRETVGSKCPIAFNPLMRKDFWANVGAPRGLPYVHFGLILHNSKKYDPADDVEKVSLLMGVKLVVLNSPICPLAQFYRINNRQSFLIASMQDSRQFSVVISTWNWKEVGFFSEHWNYSAGGEISVLALIHDDPRYVMGKEANLRNHRLAWYEVRWDRPQCDDCTNPYILAEMPQICAIATIWNAPIIWSQHESQALFTHGSNMFSVVGIMVR